MAIEAPIVKKEPAKVRGRSKASDNNEKQVVVIAPPVKVNKVTRPKRAKT